MEDEVIMSRMVRAVGDGRRAELILFLIELLSDHSHRLGDFSPGTAMSEAFVLLSDTVSRHHWKSVRIDE